MYTYVLYAYMYVLDLHEELNDSRGLQVLAKYAVWHRYLYVLYAYMYVLDQYDKL